MSACMCVCKCIIWCFQTQTELPGPAKKGAHGGDDSDLSVQCDRQKHSPLINGLELEHSTGTL